jgi:hypothetical protein
VRLVCGLPDKLAGCVIPSVAWAVGLDALYQLSALGEVLL